MAYFVFPRSMKEADAESPVFDSFYNSGGSEAILKVCSFTPTEFRQLSDIFSASIATNWNTGRGKKSKLNPMDVLFMTLVVMKHRTSWHQHAWCFSINTLAFIRLIFRLCYKIVEFVSNISLDERLRSQL